jgi:hypothetical protein
VHERLTTDRAAAVAHPMQYSLQLYASVGLKTATL